MAPSRILFALVLVTSFQLAHADSDRAQTDDVIVTGTRFKERPEDLPIAVDVIRREQLDEAAGRSLPELLKQQPGISVRDFFGNYSSSSVIDLRGFGASAGPNTAILLDGRRIRDIDFSGVQWPGIALDSLARVEILRGGGAVMYGDGAVGGVVNLVTRAPFERPEGASVRVESGSFGSRSVGISNNVLGDSVGLSLHGNRIEAGGYRQNNENRVTNLGATLEWVGGPWRSLVSGGTDQQDLRLPGARTVNPAVALDEMASDPRGTSTPMDSSSHDGQFVQLDLTGSFDNLTPGLSLGYRGKRDKSYFDFGGFPDYRQIDLSSINVSPRLKGNWASAMGNQSLVVGADYYRWYYRLHRSDSPIHAETPVNSVQANQENTALYAAYTLQPEPSHLISVGHRQERQRLSATDTFEPAAPGGTFGSGAAPANQAVREHAEELAWRHDLSSVLAGTVRYARAYRFATVDEIYETGPLFTNEFQLLRPQTSRNLDLGLEYRSAGFQARLTLFDMALQDEIHLDLFSSGVGNTNLPKSRRRGLEWETEFAIDGSNQITASYTFTDARFMDANLAGADLTGKEVPLVSRHQANASWNHRLDDAWRFNLRAQYQGTRRMDNDEQNLFATRMPAYTLLDVTVVYQWSRWNISLAVNNITNTRYYDYAVSSVSTPGKYNAYPMPERAIALSASYRFEK
jgi:iron complex outermembrane receptor protein